MSYLMKILRSIFLVLFIPVTLSLTADKVSTTRKHLRLSPAISCPRDSAVLLADTIPHPVGVLRFCGYEKSLRAPRETIFIENLSDSSTIEKINFTIDYFAAVPCGSPSKFPRTRHAASISRPGTYRGHIIISADRAHANPPPPTT